MSRSYRKFLSYPHYEFDSSDWSSFRFKERQNIHTEVYSTEHGDVLFPQYYGSDEGSWNSSRRYYYPKTKIRKKYFEEIRNILNGYQDWVFLWRRKRGEQCKDHQQIYLETFNRIKKGISSYGNESCFEWLNTREAKEAVKNWDNDPLDILYYLTRSGIIEKAVRNECKKINRK